MDSEGYATRLAVSLNLPQPLQIQAEDTPDGPWPRVVLLRGR